MPKATPELQREYQREWMRRRRAEFFEGARCVYCGAARDLQVNHLVPLKIEPRHGDHRFWSRRREVIEEELARCVPCCAACNRRHALAMGVGRPGAKLDEDAVRYIRASHGERSLDELAERFGVSVAAIRDVINGRTFRDLDEDFSRILQFQPADTTSAGYCLPRAA